MRPLLARFWLLHIAMFLILRDFVEFHCSHGVADLMLFVFLLRDAGCQLFLVDANANISVPVAAMAPLR